MTGGGNVLCTSCADNHATPKNSKHQKRIPFITSPMWKGRCAATVRRAKQSSGLKVLQTNSRNVMGNRKGHTKLGEAGKRVKTTEKMFGCTNAEDKENPNVCLQVRKTVQDKGVQVDLTSCHSSSNQPAHRSENGGDEYDGVGVEEYWRELAEQRRLALAETLVENEELCAEIAILKCKVKELETLANNLQYRSIVAVAEEDINTGTSQVERLPKSVENV